jgi:hypothetical protein
MRDLTGGDDIQPCNQHLVTNDCNYDPHCWGKSQSSCFLPCDVACSNLHTPRFGLNNDFPLNMLDAEKVHWPGACGVFYTASARCRWATEFSECICDGQKSTIACENITIRVVQDICEIQQGS